MKGTIVKIKIKILLILFLNIILFFCGCKNLLENKFFRNEFHGADTIFIGNIRTMNNDYKMAEVIVCKDGKIVYVGSRVGALKYVDFDTLSFDFRKNYIYPGFIDCSYSFDKTLGNYIGIEDKIDKQKFINEIIDWQNLILEEGYTSSILHERKKYSPFVIEILNELIKTKKIKIKLLFSDDIMNILNELKNPKQFSLLYNKLLSLKIDNIDSIGTIEKGKSADFSVFDYDFFDENLDFDKIEDNKPYATIINGEIVFLNENKGIDD